MDYYYLILEINEMLVWIKQSYDIWARQMNVSVILY